MSAMARILGTYAAGHALAHGGREYVFGRIDLAKSADLETAYFKRAREAVYRMAGEVSDEVYDRALQRVTDKYNAGAFAFPVGESFRYYLSSGLAELVCLLTGCDRKDADALAQERAAEVMHVCLCVVAESFPDLKKKILRTAEAGGKEFEELERLLSTE